MEKGTTGPERGVSAAVNHTQKFRSCEGVISGNEENGLRVWMYLRRPARRFLIQEQGSRYVPRKIWRIITQAPGSRSSTSLLVKDSIHQFCTPSYLIQYSYPSVTIRPQRLADSVAERTRCWAMSEEPLVIYLPGNGNWLYFPHDCLRDTINRWLSERQHSSATGGPTIWRKIQTQQIRLLWRMMRNAINFYISETVGKSLLPVLYLVWSADTVWTWTSSIRNTQNLCTWD